MTRNYVVLGGRNAALAVWMSVCMGGRVAAAEMEFVRVADDKRSFVLEPSGRKFVPWGFNYDHDEAAG